MRGAASLTLIVLGVLAAPAQAATFDVSVGNNAFSPAQLTITQGDSVTWTWVGPDTNHSATTGMDQVEQWDSDPRNPAPNHAVGDKFSHDFDRPGEYPYFCKVHSFMTGRIVVRERQNNPNPPPQDIVGPKFSTVRVNVARRRVTFRLDEAGRVRGTLRGPTRRTLTHAGTPGANVMKLPRRLREGRYALVLRAVDAADNESAAARVKFRVPRGR